MHCFLVSSKFSRQAKKVFPKEKLGAVTLSGTMARGEDHEKCDYLHIFRYITDVLEIETI